MAVIWPTPTLSDGHLVDENDWEQLTDNLDDLNTRLGTGTGTDLATRVSSLETGKVPNTRSVATSNGLTGGGDLTANRTLAVDFGNSATQVATGARATALEAIVATGGDFYSTSTQTASSGAGIISVTGWVNNPGSGTISGVSVSGSTFTITSAGWYSLSFNVAANSLGTAPQTGLAGAGLQDLTVTTKYYAFNQILNTSAAGAVGINLSGARARVWLPAGTTFKLIVLNTNSNGMQLAGTSTTQTTNVSVTRVG